MADRRFGVTRHGVNQKIIRRVRSVDELDAIKRPLATPPIRRDQLGRPSQHRVGERAEVVLNPETGQSLPINPTLTRKAQRLRRRFGLGE